MAWARNRQRQPGRTSSNSAPATTSDSIPDMAKSKSTAASSSLDPDNVATANRPVCLLLNNRLQPQSVVAKVGREPVRVAIAGHSHGEIDVLSEPRGFPHRDCESTDKRPSGMLRVRLPGNDAQDMPELDHAPGRLGRFRNPDGSSIDRKWSR